jgi:hypothetical protein
MPYLYQTIEGEAAQAFAQKRPPFGVGLTPEEAASITKVEHIASSFKDPGNDWNRFDCFDQSGKKLFSRQFDGY